MKLALVLLVAIAAAQTAPKKLPPITYQAAERALKLAPKLKPGLTVKQTWQELGLAKFAEPQMAHGSGPSNRYLMNYELTRYHRITLTIDYRQKPPRVLKASPIKFEIRPAGRDSI